MSAQKPKIFISHASGDKGAIKPIAEALLRSGYGLFIDRPEELDWGIRYCRENEVSFLSGGDFGIQLRVAVREADAILGCLSSNLTNERQVWKEELLVGEHLEKLALCRIDDVLPEAFDAVDTGTIQLERLQSRRVRVPAADPLEPVADGVVDKLLDNPAFSFVLYELEQLTGRKDTDVPAPSPEPVDAPPPKPAADMPDAAPEPETPARDWVDLSYTTQAGAEPTVLPCVIRVLSDLGHDYDLPPVHERRFQTVDVHNFDDVMRATRPTLQIRVPNTVLGEDELLAVQFTPEYLSDFTPSGLARQIPSLNLLLQHRMSMQSLLRMMDGKPDAENMLVAIQENPEWMLMILQSDWGPDASDEDEDTPKADAPPYGDEITIQEIGDLLNHKFRVRSDVAANELRRAVYMFCQTGLQDAALLNDSVSETLTTMVHRFDAMLNRQIDEILHHPEYQRLESAWRGLFHLADACAQDRGARIEVMNISKDELTKVFRKYPGGKHTYSPVYKWFVDNAFGTLGGIPATCAVADYYFDHTPRDVDVLHSLSRVAAAAQTVCLTAASPALFQMDGWAELPLPQRLFEVFESPEYARWRSLRSNIDTQFIALTAPRFAARVPFGPDNPDPELEYYEDLDGNWGEKICWANAAYAVAANISRAHARYGWPAQITGLNGGPALAELPAITVYLDTGSLDSLCPTEVELTLNRAREVASLGVMPLVHQRGSTRAALLGTNALHSPYEYTVASVTQEAANAVDLHRVLPAARVMHHLRCMIRDLAPSVSSVSELNDALNAWLAQYVTETGPTTAIRPLGFSGVTLEDAELGRAFIIPGYQIKGEASPIEWTFHFNL